MIISFIRNLLEHNVPTSEIIIVVFAYVFAILCALMFHEWAHGFAAYKNGDLTAKNLGRLTLNPMKHIDPIGFLMLLFAGFGWAKPVPVNPNNFNKLKKGIFLTAIAGVTANFILAFLTTGLAMLCEMLVIGYSGATAIKLLLKLLYYYFYFMSVINVTLIVFNLLPIYPLDGFRIVEAFTHHTNSFVRFMYRYGSFVLLGLIILGTFSPVLDLLGYYITFASSVISLPINLFWGIFF